jgi:peptidyl-prolyl cis-trans isomerase C/foldase protein PrsA
VALLIAGCPEQPNPRPSAPADAPLATVDGESISRESFERELGREFNLGQGLAGNPGIGQEALKRFVLENMIERVLLLRVAREASIFPSPEEVDREMRRLSADYTDDRFTDALAQGQLSLAELKAKTSAMLTIEKLFQQQVYSRVAVTEQEIRSYYEEHSGDFEQPEQVRAAQIVVKSAQEARQILQQLRAGKDFAELARKYSLSPDAKAGGDLGFFARGKMPRRFDEVTFRLKLNQVSDVISTEYGFHVFKLLAKRPARRRPIAEVRGQIERKLLAEKREQAQAEYVKMLKKKAAINIDESILAAAAAGPSSRSTEP